MWTPISGVEILNFVRPTSLRPPSYDVCDIQELNFTVNPGRGVICRRQRRSLTGCWSLETPHSPQLSFTTQKRAGSKFSHLPIFDFFLSSSKDLYLLWFCRFVQQKHFELNWKEKDTQRADIEENGLIETEKELEKPKEEPQRALVEAAWEKGKEEWCDWRGRRGGRKGMSGW